MPRTASLPLDCGPALATRLARAVPTVESALLDGLGPHPPFLLDADDAHSGGRDGHAAAESLTRALTLLVAPPLTDGRALAASAAAAAAVPLPFSIPGLDALLSGGLRRGWLTELAGPPGAGKTQACLAAAAATVARGATALFMHTGPSFPAGRFAGLVRASLGGRCGAEDASAALDRLAVVCVSSLAAAGAALDAAAASAAATSGSTPAPSLIVLDSIAAAAAPGLLRTTDGGSVSGPAPATQGRACLLALAHQLKAFAGATGAAALVTNTASEGPPPLPGAAPTWRPGLGEGWAPAPHVRVLLLPPPPAGELPPGATAAAPCPPRLAHLLVGPPPKDGSGGVAAWRVPGEE